MVKRRIWTKPVLAAFTLPAQVSTVGLSAVSQANDMANTFCFIIRQTHLALPVWHLSGAWPAARGVYPSCYGHPKFSRVQWAAGEEGFKRSNFPWIKCFGCSLPINSSAVHYSCSLLEPLLFQFSSWNFVFALMTGSFTLNWRLQVLLDFQDLIVQGNICVVKKLSLQPCFETRSDLNIQYMRFFVPLI